MQPIDAVWIIGLAGLLFFLIIKRDKKKSN